MENLSEKLKRSDGQNLFDRLNIPEQRGLFLLQKCKDYFSNAIQENSKEKDIVDAMFDLRELCTNASEDMLVCFLCGVSQTNLIQHTRNIEALKNILKNF